MTPADDAEQIADLQRENAQIREENARFGVERKGAADLLCELAEHLALVISQRDKLEAVNLELRTIGDKMLANWFRGSMRVGSFGILRTAWQKAKGKQ